METAQTALKLVSTKDCLEDRINGMEMRDVDYLEVERADNSAV